MKANNTRARILEAALKSFSKKGYLGATTREIAREAGIAEVTLFRHFPSKEKLFEEVISAHSFLPTLKGLLPAASTMSFEEALTLIAVRFLETLNLRKDMIRIMHSEMQRYPEKIHRIYHAFVDEVRDTLASYFSDLQREGVLRQFDAALGARAFFGMFLSYFNAEGFLMRKKYRSTDVDETIRQYVGIFVKGTMK